ncbi:MAG: translesion error-prone DNA polymerase V autoproteolytic subunit [Candidatus Kapabacteria bacterium]|nr:translesion error-prone DNA polymerase V autoproteolytic subunit [Candidatus Kapabacteria bacterium]
MQTKIQLGIRHRQIRESVLKMSVADYAKHMQVKVPTVYSWESGRTTVPQEVLASLEKRHGVSSGWLLTGTGSPTISTVQSDQDAQNTHKTALERLEEQVLSIRAVIAELKAHSPLVVAPARGSKGSHGPRIPMLSLGVSAGLPTASDDTIEREIDLADMLLEHPESTYFIRVVGDSMTDAGISDGDTLIVDCAIQPRSGQIVIAKVYGELTVKRYLKAEGRPVLRAENRRYKDIAITAEMDFTIVGVVRSCIKKF